MIPYLRYPKFKQWQNLTIQLQPLSQGSFLRWLDSTCSNDGIVIQIKPFLFSLRNLFFNFVTMMMVHKFGDLNLRSIHLTIYTPHLKNLDQLLIRCFSYCHIVGRRKLFVYIKNKQQYLPSLNTWVNFLDQASNVLNT